LKIAFLIRQLSTGGAEQQLARAAAGLAARGHEITVLTFYSGGLLSADLAGTGVAHVNLNKTGRWDVVGFLSRLSSQLAGRRIEVLYTFLPSANVIGAWLRIFKRVPRLVCGVRASRMEGSSYDWLGSSVAAVEDAALGRADAIISNSRAGAARFAESRTASCVYVVPNGIDATQYARDPQARESMRRHWRIPAETCLVGMVGRLDPMKGHEYALSAFAAVRERRADIRLLIIGDGPAERVAMLRAEAERHGLSEAVIFAPAMQPVSTAYSALDVLMNASVYGEGFSNVLCEAILCGCRCIATDVGDSAMILGMPEYVAPPRDDVALAGALERAIGTESDTRWIRARERITAEFSTAAMLDRTEEILSAIVCGQPGGPRTPDSKNRRT
jgi:glycosyltransferase involved in cell wall biosynthesis